MSFADAEKTQDAINGLAASAGAAGAAALALCIELARAGVLPREAIARIRDAALHDVDATILASGSAHARTVRAAYSRSFKDAFDLI